MTEEGKMITIDEYIKKIKKELDDFKDRYTEGNKKYPDIYPLSLSHKRWLKNELDFRRIYRI